MVEKKAYTQYYGTPTTPISPGTTWSFYSALQGLQQGTTGETRIGDKIRLHSIEWTVRCTPTSAIVGAGDQLRIVIYHNKLTNGVLISAPQVFDINELGALRAHDYKDKVTILRDKVCTCVVTAVKDSDGTTQAQGPRMLVRFKIFPKKVITYTDNTTNMTALLKDDYGIGFCTLGSDVQVGLLTAQVVFTDS